MGRQASSRGDLSQSLLLSVLADLLRGALSWLFRRTHGVTSQLLARRPRVPGLAVVDARSNRVRLRFLPQRSSPFNRDVYEAQHAEADAGGAPSSDWRSDPDTAEEGRVIAPLRQSTRYLFRVRAKNVRGKSAWSEPVAAATLAVPVDGGAVLPEFTWTQSGVEVTILCAAPPATRAADVLVELRPQHLRVAVRQGGAETTLLEGRLPQRVRSLTPGGTSHWELHREGGGCQLCVLLEKERPARNIKFDFWRSALEGGPEIDTHVIDSDSHVALPQPVGGLDAASLSAGPAGRRLRSKGDQIELSSLPIDMQRLYKQ